MMPLGGRSQAELPDMHRDPFGKGEKIPLGSLCVSLFT
jgi:hypothetical protein